MKNEFTQLLLADPRITAFVGNRIDWGISPQGLPAPRLTMHRISKVNQNTMKGQDALSTYRIQIDIIAPTHDQADQISQVINKAIGGRTALIGGVEFGGIFAAGSRSGHAGTEAELIHIIRDDYFINCKTRAEA